ncbi:hypothetical protein Ddc_10291 [Ditylenchus destructor]|nr:hypothetical protein Ddc_10291 [Ditylenchus destructor]
MTSVCCLDEPKVRKTSDPERDVGEELYSVTLLKTCKQDDKFYIPVYSKSTFTNTSEPISSFSGTGPSSLDTPRAYPGSEPPPKPVTTTVASTTETSTTVTKNSTTPMPTTKEVEKTTIAL